MASPDDDGASTGSAGSPRCRCDRLGLSHNPRLGRDGARAIAARLTSAAAAPRIPPVGLEHSEQIPSPSPPSSHGGGLERALSPGPVVGSWLRELFMSDCGVGPGGGVALASALHACPALEKLGLNYNGERACVLRACRVLQCEHGMCVQLAGFGL